MTRLPEKHIGTYPESEANEFTVKHDLGCKNVVVRFFDVKTDEEIFLSYWVLDYNTIIVTSAQYYLVNGNIRYLPGKLLRPHSVRVVLVG